jgi:hypothetical protein
VRRTQIHPRHGEILGHRRFGWLRATPAQASPYDFNSLPWSDAQKVAASLRAIAVDNAPAFLNDRMVLPFPPVDSTPFTTTTPDGTSIGGFAAYPAAGAAPLVILQKTIDQGKIAIFRKLAITNQGGNPPDGTGNVIWRLLINGAAVKGMNAMLSQYGVLSVPKDCQILAMENDVVQITVEVPAGKVPPPGTTAASLDGFTYPIAEAIMPHAEATA